MSSPHEGAKPPKDANDEDASSTTAESVLGKRKRIDDDDGIDEDDPEDSLFIPDENSTSLVLYGSNLQYSDESMEDDDDEGAKDDSNSDTEDEFLGDNNGVEQQVHVEASEPFPKCAIYDEEISALKAMLTSIPKMVIEALAPHKCEGKHYQTHMDAAKALVEIPTTKRLRVALLGGAGAGKW